MDQKWSFTIFCGNHYFDDNMIIHWWIFYFSVIEDLRDTRLSTANRIKDLERRLESLCVGGVPAASSSKSAAVAAPVAAKNDDEDDDGVDLFGSDSEDEDDAAAKVREQRLAEYAAKKSKSKFKRLKK